MTEKINLNTATVEQIAKINMIGKERAQAIVDYREAKGPYKDISELKNIPGFGEKLSESLVIYFEVTGEEKKEEKGKTRR